MAAAIATSSVETTWGACADLTYPDPPLIFDLEGLTSVSFVGATPKITRVEGAPQLKVVAYSSDVEPEVEVVDGKLLVTSGSCSVAEESGGTATRQLNTMSMIAGMSLGLLTGWATTDSFVGGLGLSLSLFIPGAFADGHSSSECENVVEVEIHGPVVSAGQCKYMLVGHVVRILHSHFGPQPTWRTISDGLTLTGAKDHSTSHPIPLGETMLRQCGDSARQNRGECTTTAIRFSWAWPRRAS